MIETKLFEIRDRLTFIPAIATNCCCKRSDTTPQEDYLLGRAGYGSAVLLTRLGGGYYSYCKSHDWADRTMSVAHEYIEENWHELTSGDVIDVEYILGETTTKKVSESIIES